MDDGTYMVWEIRWSEGGRIEGCIFSAITCWLIYITCIEAMYVVLDLSRRCMEVDFFIYWIYGLWGTLNVNVNVYRRR